ncbi:SBBP repeat-containing protein [Corallococcus sp. AS-1-6]|uniref:SBBP repeat-containing protein n=1 Tax=Corallococcus sp. AS-1-6 TaxID=2874599 RepID=UPI001CBF970C|nr:SBBP repeat-containing protein [Corallococcus sp. AS-1-6]MBZ4373460.1 SBBP repeat-containing protein [Corallococcus sp. AS-1-6]
MMRSAKLRLVLGLSWLGGGAAEAQSPEHLTPPVWSRQLGTTRYEQVSGIAASFNDVFLAGYSQGQLGTEPSAGSSDAFVARLRASGEVAWTRQFGSSANEYVTGAAVHDASPNAVAVYATGYTSAALPGNVLVGMSDAFLARYDAQGGLQWLRQFGTSSGDFAQGVATAPDGNVYVVGYTSASMDGQAWAGGQDAFVVKYDAAGDRQWSRLTGTSKNDQARAVAVGADGSVYVTGFTFGGLNGNANAGGTSSTTSDLFLVKYDAAGQRLWTRQLGTSTPDVAQAVATSRRASGEVEIYVAGRTQGGLDGNASLGSHDIVVVKYDASGNRVWTRQLGTSGEEQVFGVTSDGGGNVYVTGSVPSDLQTDAPLGSNDLVLFKLDAAGGLQARRQLGSTPAGDPARISDAGLAVAVDPGRGVYVGGYTEGLLGATPSGDKDAVVVKYLEGCEETSPGQCAWGYGWGRQRAPDGWVRQLGSTLDDHAAAIVATQDGLYTVGETYGSFHGGAPLGGGDLFLSAHDTQGGLRWVRQFGTADDELIGSLAADGAGNLYVAGGTSGAFTGHTSAGFFDAFLARYDASGQRLWTWQLGSSEFDLARAVAAAPGGGVYVVGSTYGNLDGNLSAGYGESDFFISKVDAAGGREWTRQLGTAGPDEAVAVAVDSLGGVYVAGTTSGGMGTGGSQGDTDVVLVKLDADGHVLWSRQMGSPGPDSTVGVVETSAGILVAGGAGSGGGGQPSLGGNDFFTALVTPSTGQPLGWRQFGSGFDEYVGGLSTDGAGGAWLTGSTLGAMGTPLGGQDAVLIHLSAQGQPQQVRQLGTVDDEHATGVTVDAQGRVYLVGETLGVFEGQASSGSFDVFVLKDDAPLD